MIYLSLGIRYFLGRTGSGKSYRTMQEIVADLKKDSDYPLILLVPEQFTLQAERDLIEKMDLPGIMRVEVLSFTRLAFRVFNEVGGYPDNYQRTGKEYDFTKNH
jgi:ATP-dependent helicase/nuclease subunit B